MKFVRDELTLSKSHRFVVVDVGKVHQEVGLLAPVRTTATCKHTPRFRGDSHSSVLPRPAVETWPEDDDAYNFALTKVLSDCSEPRVYT